jgi:hypothetical protein
LLQALLLRSELSAAAQAFADGVEVADQVRPAQLAIAHYNPTTADSDQLDGGGCRSTQDLDEHNHHNGDHDPLPAALPIGIVAVCIAGGRAGLNRCAQDLVYDVGHRLLTGRLQRLGHRFCQRYAQALADCGDCATTDLNSLLLIQQRLGLAETQGEGTAQQTH